MQFSQPPLNQINLSSMSNEISNHQSESVPIELSDSDQFVLTHEMKDNSAKVRNVMNNTEKNIKV